MLAELLEVRLRLHLVLGALEEETERAKHVHLFIFVIDVAHIIVTVRVDVLTGLCGALDGRGLGPLHDQLDILLVLLRLFNYIIDGRLTLLGAASFGGGLDFGHSKVLLLEAVVSVHSLLYSGHLGGSGLVLRLLGLVLDGHVVIR